MPVIQGSSLRESLTRSGGDFEGQPLLSWILPGMGHPSSRRVCLVWGSERVSAAHRE